MRIGTLSRPASALLVIALAACRQVEDLPGPPAAVPNGDPSRVREIQAAKSAETDPVRLEALLREIQLRYGHSVPATASVPEAPEKEGLEPAVAGEEMPPVEAGALGKSAAYADVWLTVKTFDFGNNRAFKRVYIVPPGRSITVEAEAEVRSDPMILAFTPNDRTPGASAYKTVVRAFNDDRDSGWLDARISWKNNTDSDRELHVMVIAQNAATTGRTNISVYPSSGSPSFFSGIPMTAAPTYTNNVRPLAGCTSLGSSRIQMIWREGWGAAGILAFNNAERSGGTILENGTTTQTLVLEDPLTVGNWNFLMGFMLHPVGTGTRYTGVQQNLYSCPIP